MIELAWLYIDHYRIELTTGLIPFGSLNPDLDELYCELQGHRNDGNWTGVTILSRPVQVGGLLHVLYQITAYTTNKQMWISWV